MRQLAARTSKATDEIVSVVEKNPVLSDEVMHQMFSTRENAEQGLELANQAEAEEIFFNEPLLVLDDSKHSQTEARFHALGVTDDERRLHITLTLRQNGTPIRVISARDMHRKERAVYEQAKKDT